MSLLFGLADLLLLYKAHVRSQVEWCNGAIAHASFCLLSHLDSVQTSFLSHVGLCSRAAFLDFNVAPLQMRRDIGLLGMLYKISHGLAHPEFGALFPRIERKASHQTRVARRRHDRQFVDPCDGSQLDIFARSLFGLIKVWNNLPSEFVSSKSVKSFQVRLTAATKCACADNAERWERMYSMNSMPQVLL